MIEKTACFTGHRYLKREFIPAITKRLESVIDNLVAQGIVFYGSGGATGFDLIAGYTVLKMKERHPEIKLIMVLPCRNQDAKWNQADKERYKKLLESADKCVWTQEEYDNQCMLKRNRHLVDNSSVCIAYLTNMRGGTFFTVNYAKSKNRRVINISDVAR